jgi:hypothetical protein
VCARVCLYFVTIMHANIGRSGDARDCIQLLALTIAISKAAEVKGCM